MGYTRHYNSCLEADKVALRDLVGWFGWKKSLLIFREVKKCSTYAHLDQCNIALSFGGVEGRPVLALFRRFFGEEIVATWRTVDHWPKGSYFTFYEPVQCSGGDAVAEVIG